MYSSRVRNNEAFHHIQNDVVNVKWWPINKIIKHVCPQFVNFVTVLDLIEFSRVCQSWSGIGAAKRRDVGDGSSRKTVNWVIGRCNLVKR